MLIIMNIKNDNYQHHDLCKTTCTSACTTSWLKSGRQITWTPPCWPSSTCTKLNFFYICFCSFLSRWLPPSAFGGCYFLQRGKAKYYCHGTYQSYLKQFCFSRRAKRNNAKTNENQVMESVRQHDDDLQYCLLCFKYLSPVGWSEQCSQHSKYLSENQ